MLQYNHIQTCRHVADTGLVVEEEKSEKSQKSSAPLLLWERVDRHCGDHGTLRDQESGEWCNPAFRRRMWDGGGNVAVLGQSPGGAVAFTDKGAIISGPGLAKACPG
jgi:hypothetical protein